MAGNKSATHPVDLHARELERLRADIARLQQDNVRLRHALRDAATRAQNLADVAGQAINCASIQRSWLDKVVHQAACALDRNLARAIEDDEQTKVDDR